MASVKNILQNVFTGASVATSVMLVLVAYSDHLHPEAYPRLACIGMTFPFFLLLNLLTLIVWVIFNWRRSWIPLLAYLLALPAIRVYMPLHFHHEPPPGSLKVLSYNVASYSIDRKQSPGEKEIFNYVKQQNADIVCLQEDMAHKGDSLGDFTKLYAYNDTAHLGKALKVGFNAMGIHSRYPIVGKEVINYESRANGSVAFFVKVGADTIIVINNHLETNHLSFVDKKCYADLISGDMNSQDAQAETRKLMGKLTKSMGIRSHQAEAVHDYIERHRRYPMVVCGDFNDTPISYVRRTIAQGLTDCFVESGCGLGFSFRAKGFYFRIDHIMCSDHFEPYNCFVDKSIEASDHYPIMCWLKRK